MKTVRFLIPVLILAAGSLVKAQDFIIGAHLDPYSAHGSTPSSATIQVKATL